jgi:hypothetical protein
MDVSGGGALHEHAETPFVFFAVMTVVQFVVVLFVYPETKGQTLEALQRRLVKATLNASPPRGRPVRGPPDLWRQVTGSD